MLIIAKNNEICRIKKPFPSIFDFRFKSNPNGIKNDNRHKRLSYFGRKDKKCDKIAFHQWKQSLVVTK